MSYETHPLCSTMLSPLFLSRVFHARNSFTGQRTMTGYYVQRGAFLSKIHALRERLGKN